jgi:hypothetical protein
LHIARQNAVDLIIGVRLSEALFADRYNWIYPPPKAWRKTEQSPSRGIRGECASDERKNTGVERAKALPNGAGFL